MIRRWLRGCLLSSALGFSVVGCTSSIEQLTGGLVPAPKEGGDPPPSHTSDELNGNEQLRLHLDSALQMDKAGNDEAALTDYERVLQLDRNNFTAMRRLCVLYDRRGGREDFKKAEEFYQKVAKIRPKDPEIWSDWGYSLFLRTDKEHYKENWAEAEQKLRQALKLDPDNARAHMHLAKLLGVQDHYEEAFREFRAAHLSESEAHFNMAAVYMFNGKFEEAKQEYRIVREKDPSNTKALDYLTELEQPPRSRDKLNGRKPRTPEQDEKEHEAARRTVAALYPGAAEQVPTGPFRANGTMWMPVQSVPRSQPAVPSSPTPLPPVPVTPAGGNSATISFDN